MTDSNKFTYCTDPSDSQSDMWVRVLEPLEENDQNNQGAHVSLSCYLRF